MALFDVVGEVVQALRVVPGDLLVEHVVREARESRANSIDDWSFALLSLKRVRYGAGVKDRDPHESTRSLNRHRAS